METMQELFGILPQVGRIEWIGLRSARLSEITVVEEAILVAERGLQGDHKAAGRAGTKRQLTLIQHEHLIAVAGMLHGQNA